MPEIDPQTPEPQPSTDHPAGEPTPTPEAPEPETPRGLKGSGLRYGDADGVPSWAIGKTADEILATADQLYGALQRGESQVNHVVPPQVSSVPPSPSNGIPSVDPNLIYSNPDEYHRQMEAKTEALISARLAEATASVVTPLASLARSEASRNKKYAIAWDRYAPEIETIMARVPETQRGRVDLWNEAARMVQGDHTDEIARLKADEILRGAGDAGSLPTQGGTPSAPTPTGGSPIEKLFHANHASIKGFKEDSISARQVIDHARKMGHSEEAYAKILTDRAERRVTA